MLKLYNTLTSKTQPFQPNNDMQVKMYTCGPSTYQPAHIGNYRTFLFEDILQRYLEYKGYQVRRVMTLTDVEDKAVAQAKKEKIPLEELTRKNEAVFFKDLETLRIKKPDYPIRASNAVDQAASLISKLIETEYAYRYDYKGAKNIYFDPLKFQGFGKLAHLDMSKWPKKSAVSTKIPTPAHHGTRAILCFGMDANPMMYAMKQRLALDDQLGTYRTLQS
ncbi:MAG: class I tRNA ligase family protein [Candidatus Bathyarchaeota archaeon]|nr:class I tRNA ligase family protein [Candidatus Bathyarchaeota archaeon]